MVLPKLGDKHFDHYIIVKSAVRNKMSSHVHSLNNSPGKQKYSFGKEGRFRYDKPQYHPPHTDPMSITSPPAIAIDAVHSSVTENAHLE